MLVVTLAVYAGYLVLLLGQPRPLGLAATEYVRPLLYSIGIAIAASIALDILIGIFTGRGDARSDQRDREIYRSGEAIGQSFVVIGGVAALVLALLRAEHFWIANAVYLAFVLSAVLASVAKIAFYRGGYHRA